MKMNKISLSISTALLAAGFMTSSAVNAQGRLVVYCSATNILCETTTKAFGEKIWCENFIYSQRFRQYFLQKLNAEKK